MLGGTTLFALDGRCAATSGAASGERLSIAVLIAALLLTACGGDSPLGDGRGHEDALSRVRVSEGDEPALLADELPLSRDFFAEHGIAREDELTSLRTATTFTFRRPDGSLLAVIGSGLESYVDDAGRYRPIRATLEPFSGAAPIDLLAPALEGEAGDRRLAATSSAPVAPNDFEMPLAKPQFLPGAKLDARPFPVAHASLANNPRSYFPEDPSLGVLVAFDSREIGRLDAGMRWLPTRRVLELSCGTREETPVARGVIGEADGDRMRYHGTYPGVVEEYVVRHGRLKHDIILEEPPISAARVGEGALPGSRLTFEGKLELSPGLVPAVDGRPMEEDFTTSSAIELWDESGRAVFRLAPPYAHEAADHAIAIPIEYRVERADDGAMTLGLETPLSWLLDPARTYPVVIDPSPEAIVASHSVYTDGTSLFGDGSGTITTCRIGRTGGTTRRCAMKFPLTALPSYVQVTGVTLQVNVQSTESTGSTTRIGRVSSDTVNATAATLWSEIAGGAEYHSASDINAATGIRQQSLPAAVGDVQAEIEAESWIAFGLKHDGETNNTNTSFSYFNAEEEENRPRLMVAYDMPDLEILRFTTQPPETAHVGVPFSSQVTVVDGFGETVTGYSDEVSLQIEEGPEGAILRMNGNADVTVSPSDGVAHFEGLTLDVEGGPYALRATSVGADHEDVSNAMDVQATPAAISVVSGDGQLGAESGALGDPLVVAVEDAGGDPLHSVPIDWTVTGDAEIFGASQTAHDGLASADVVLGSTAGSYTFTASVPGTSLSVELHATAVPVPTLLAPISRAHVESARPTFVFLPGESPETLLLQWDTSPHFSSPVEQPVGPGPAGAPAAYTLSADQALIDGETYYWRVRDAYEAGAQGPWSPARSFTVDVSLDRYGWHVTTDVQLYEGEHDQTRVEGHSVALGFAPEHYFEATFEDGSLDGFSAAGCGAPLCAVENSGARSFSGTRSLRIRNESPDEYVAARRTGVLAGASGRIEFRTLRDDTKAFAGNAFFAPYHPVAAGPLQTETHYAVMVAQRARPSRYFGYTAEVDGDPGQSRTFSFAYCLPLAPWSEDTWYEVAIEYSDRVASVFVDGRPCVTNIPFVDDGYDPTSIDLYSWASDDGVVWYVDDIRAYPPAGSGSWHSPPIPFSDRPEGTAAWGTVQFTADTPGGSTIDVEVEHSTDGGQTWSAIPGALPGTTYELIRVRVDLARGDIDDPSPVLHDLSVSWEDAVTGASRLAFLTAPQTADPGDCSDLIEVRTEDALGAPAPVSFDTMVHLSSGAPSNTFHTSADCSEASRVSSLLLEQGEVGLGFYVRGTVVGEWVLTAGATGLDPADLDHVVWPPGDPAALSFTTPGQIVDATDCSAPVTVELRDEFGNTTWSLSSDTTVLLDSEPGSLSFHLSPDCADAAVSSLLIPAGDGSSEATFYFSGTTPGGYTISASATDLSPAELGVEISVGPPSAEGSTITADPTRIEADGLSTSTITVTLRDAAGNPLPRGPMGVLLFEDFEEGAVAWSTGYFSGTGTDFEIGTPTSGPGSARSGTQLAATVLDGNYTGSESPGRGSYLQSPVLDLSYADEPALRFWHWHDTEEDSVGVWDGGNVKLSVDGGSSFFELTPESVSPAYIELAPNCTYENPLCHQLGWGGESGGWLEVDIDLLPDLEGEARDQVVVRFEFGADNYPSSWDGWYIDDVRVLDTAYPDEFPVELATTGGTLSEVIDNLDGTYTATLTSSTTTQTATVSGYLYGDPIGTVDVEFRGPEPSAAHTVITAAPSSITADGAEQAAITVQLRDENGADITEGGFSVTLATDLGTLSAPSDNGNGTYTAELVSSAFGTATITGTVEGEPIADTAEVQVEPVTLTVTGPSQVLSYGDEPPALSPSYDGFVDGDDASDLDTQPTCSTSYEAGDPAGSHATTCSGGADSRYGFVYVEGSLTVEPAPLTVTAPSLTITYGDEAPELAPQYEGFVAGDGPADLDAEPTCTTPYSAGDPAGSYDTECSGGLSGNYAMTYVGGTLTVEKKSLVVTAPSLTIVYGDDAPQLDPLYEGFIAGDGPEDLDTAPVCATDYVAGDPAGEYSTSCSGGISGDYDLGYVDGVLTVDTKLLTVTAPSETLIYGEDAPALEPQYEGFTAGDGPADLDAEPTCATDYAAGDPTGSYDVECSGGASNDYHFGYVPGTITVDPALLTVTAPSATVTYGDEPPALEPEYEGFVAGDQAQALDVQPTCATDYAAGDPAGTYATECSGGESADYTIEYVEGVLTVEQKPLTITANDASKTYGSTHTFDNSADFLAEGLEPGDSVDQVVLSSDGAGSSAEVGQYDILASNATGTGLSSYTITYETGTLTVTPKTLEITARDQTKTYGETYIFDESADFTVSGLEEGDSVDSVSLSSDGADASAPMGSYDILVSGATGTNLHNYDIVYHTGTLTVVEKALTITATDATKTYGQAHAFDETSDFTVVGLEPGDSVDSVSLSSLGAPAEAAHGSYDIVASNATGEGLENYTVLYQRGTLTVHRKPLTITATDASKVYGAEHLFDSTADFTTSGLEPWDSVTSVTLSSDGAAPGAPVGDYETVAGNASGEGLSNYTITYQSGTLTVTPKPLIITADDGSKTYGQAHLFDESADFGTSGLEAGDEVTAVSLSSPGAEAAAEAGDYPIAASDATGVGLENYEIEYVEGTLTVDRAPLVITANDLSKEYGEALSFAGTEFEATGLQLADTVTSVTLQSDGAASGAEVGDYAIAPSEAMGDRLSNYDITYVNGTLSVYPAELVVTPHDASKEYGDLHSFTGTEFTATGLKAEDEVTSVSLSSDGAGEEAAVGDYPIVASEAQGTGLSNYQITYVDGTLTVQPANLTIIANDASKEYGDPLVFAGTEIATDGLKLSDTVTSVTLQSDGAAEDAPVDDYVIVASDAQGTGLSNYVIDYVDGTLSVYAAGLSIIADDASKEYGETLVFAGTEFTTVGLKLGDSVTGVSLDSAGTPEDAPAADYPIVPSEAAGTGLSNYDITYVDGTLTVHPAQLVITAHDASKEYGEALTFTGTEFSATGLAAGDALTGVTLQSDGAAQDAPVADYAIVPSDAEGADLSNYQVTYVEGTLTVYPAQLTITAHDASKEYGDALIFTGTELEASGLKVGDTVTSATLQSDGAGESAAVGDYPIVASEAQGTGLSNYQITYVDGTLTVQPAQLTITASDLSKEYGEELTLSGTEFQATGLKVDDTVTSVDLQSAGAAADADAGSYDIVAGDAQGSGLSNYEIEYVGGTLVVHRRGLTIAAHDRIKIYGETLVFEETSDFDALGLILGDSVTSVTLHSDGADPAAELGDYPIHIGDAVGDGLDNYEIEYQNGTLTVVEKALTIRAADKVKVYGETLVLDETSDFLVFGLEDDDSVDGVTLFSDGAAETAPAGTYEITASGAVGQGLENYTIVYEAGSLEVQPAELTVTAPSATLTYGDPPPTLSPIYDGLVAGDAPRDLDAQPTCTTAYDSGEPVGSYAVECSGGVSGDYDFVYVDGAITVIEADLVITAHDLVKTYGETLTFTGSEFDAEGLVPGDTIDHVSLQSDGASAAAPLGTYDITAGDAVGSGLSNYQIAYESGQLTVVPAEASELAFVSDPWTVTAGTCSGQVTVESRDEFGHVSAVSSDTDIALLADSSMLFFTDPDCQHAAGSVLLQEGESLASFHFTDTEAGTPAITADGSPALLAASQIQTITAAEIDRFQSTITADDETLIADGTSTTTITVAARDAFGNDLTDGGSTICLATTAGSLSGEQGACGPGEVEAADAGDGTYTAVLTASDSPAETAEITATIVGTGEMDDSAMVDFVSGPPFAASSVLTAAPSEIVADGIDASTITVQVKDAHDNDVSEGGALLCLSTSIGTLLGGQGGCEPGEIEASDNDDGTYASELTSTEAGAATVSASLNGDPLAAGAVVDIVPGDPWRAEIAGPNAAVAGDLVTLLVRLLDQHDNEVQAEIEISAALSGEATATIVETRPVAAGTPGTDATFTTTANGSAEVDVIAAGTGTLTICTFGEDFGGGQDCHDVLVEAGAPDHVLMVPASDTTVAGEPVDVVLSVVDAHGNVAADEVTVTLTAEGSAGGTPTLDGAPFPATVQTDSSGVLTVSLLATTAETLTLRVDAATASGGDPLPATSPHDEVEILVIAGEAHRASLSAPEEATAGVETEVTVRLVDAHDNPASGEAIVCVTASGEHGGQPSMGPDPEDGDPSTACASTDAASGGGSFTLLATKAEPVLLLAESSGLPGSGGDDDATVLVLAAAPHHLRLTPDEEPAFACEPFGVDVQVVDTFDNEVSIEATVTLSVFAPDAPDGEARIVETHFHDVDPADLPAPEVTATTDDAGWSRVEVALDETSDLRLDWSSDDLSADPAAHGLTVPFVSGPASPSLSAMAAEREVISQGRSTLITVLPLDSCGLEVGSGADVVLDDPGEAGTLTEVTDEGDGTYTAVFTGLACPTEVEIGATVDGVRLMETVPIEIICLEADPDLSRAWAMDDEAVACASHGVGALVSVVLVDSDGEDLGPDFPVEVEEDPPFVLALGDRDLDIDPDTGETLHLLRVGSNRCGDEPRPVRLVAAGVTLADTPMITFTCPEVDPSFASYEADPARAPANGADPVRVSVKARDVCDNPAFGREVTLDVLSDRLEISLEPEIGRAKDEPGAADDGSAEFELTSRLAGRSAVVATVDGVRLEASADDLVTFDLEDVVTVAYAAESGTAVPGQTVRFTAEVESHYGARLDELRILPEHHGLVTLRVDGATVEEDGSLILPALEAESTYSMDIVALVSVGHEAASSTLELRYGIDELGATNAVRSPEVRLTLTGRHYQHGCECGAATGRPTVQHLMWLMLILFFFRRGRRRAASPRDAQP